jgi:signal transduction histidine kinase
MQKVFDPFYRLEGSRSRETGGTGLGLSIARNIAQMHGGDVRLRNHEEGGLEATLTLPWTPERAEWNAQAAKDPSFHEARASETMSDPRSRRAAL